jgi:hypothetical protein
MEELSHYVYFNLAVAKWLAEPRRQWEPLIDNCSGRDIRSPIAVVDTFVPSISFRAGLIDAEAQLREEQNTWLKMEETFAMRGDHPELVRNALDGSAVGAFRDYTKDLLDASYWLHRVSSPVLHGAISRI